MKTLAMENSNCKYDVMKEGFPSFCETLSKHKIEIERKPIEILQINVGKLCNQSCSHCHVDAGPSRKEIMEKKTIDRIITLLKQSPLIHTVDITGGAPELNPNFYTLVTYARELKKRVINRCNLTILLEKANVNTANFLREQGVKIVASLPCYTSDNVEKQRGRGVFEKSIRALKLLNELGYGKSNSGLLLDLVYNPAGPSLPPPQEKLESDYKIELKKLYGIEFNKLYTITNLPIKRFLDYLHKTKKYDKYMKLLASNFNPQTSMGIMCRNLISISWDGKIYDCDFNQMVEIPIGGKRTIWDIESFDELQKDKIAFSDHCYACTAGAGSSCGGAIMEAKSDIHEAVKVYYSQNLKTKADLKTSACCEIDSLPSHLNSIVSKIHPEVLEKFYGCGSPIPAVLEGKTVLDIGCGSGRDTFILSKLVGEEGKVIGIDMTAEQLDVAKRHIEYHRQLFGYKKSNVEFIEGYIEDLAKLGIKTDSIDVVVSNCVLNLSPEKKQLFSEIFRVLAPGGELYFSDVFAGRRVPEAITRDPILIGECLGGALYIEDFRRLLAEIGYPDYRIVTRRKITLKNPEIEHKVRMIPFYSMTIRAFKLKLEDRCEDYGQTAYYLGTIPQCPNGFPLDNHHLFEKGRVSLVCSNTAAMLSETRYSQHFRIEGDLSTHYGLFDCGANKTIIEANGSSGGSNNMGCC